MEQCISEWVLVLFAVMHMQILWDTFLPIVWSSEPHTVGDLKEGSGGKIARAEGLFSWL